MSDVGDKWEGVAPEVRRYVTGRRTVSASGVQRQFGLSFMAACQVIDALQARGVVGTYAPDGQRAVLVQAEGE
jgi:DNA segregation ATPase FtsK/SpoIIIE-like protein